MNEADTCRKFVVPLLQAAGWDNDPHSIVEQRTFTDGRIIPGARGATHRKGTWADYLLNLTRDSPLAIVEARADFNKPDDGLGQARDYVEIIAKRRDRGVDFESLAGQTGNAEADPFDLLCHLAFNSPVRSRRERVDRLKIERAELIAKYESEARAILDELLKKYAEHGEAQATLPDILKVPPFSDRNIPEIASAVSGADELW